MATVFEIEANSLLGWWEDVYSSIEPIFPVVTTIPASLSASELDSFQGRLHHASMQVQTRQYPSQIGSIHAQLVAILCNLEISCSALQAQNASESKTYYYIAQVQWIVLEAMLQKYGVELKILQ